MNQILILISILFVSVSFLNARQTTNLSSSDLAVQNKVESKQIAKETDVKKVSKNESKTNFEKKFRIILKSNHTLDDSIIVDEKNFDQSSCMCLNFTCKCCSNVETKKSKGFPLLKLTLFFVQKF
jgi:adenine C2-methylase RlmN of 23S rRNA A2503 and tRNA A37